MISQRKLRKIMMVGASIALVGLVLGTILPFLSYF